MQAPIASEKERSENRSEPLVRAALSAQKGRNTEVPRLGDTHVGSDMPSPKHGKDDTRIATPEIGCLRHPQFVGLGV